MTSCKGRALFCSQANVVFNDLYWKLPVVCDVVLMQCLTHIPFLNHSRGLPRFQKCARKTSNKIFQLSWCRAGWCRCAKLQLHWGARATARR